MGTRRDFFLNTTALVAASAALAAERAAAAVPAPPAPVADGRRPPSAAALGYRPVVTPNGSALPFQMRGGVKVMHLRAEVVQHEFAPGLVAECWGYNGTTPGPTIEALEGDRLRIYVTNRLPEATTVHWHGVRLQNGMDGVAGLTQPAIAPGETYKYEFTVRHPGTFMYHPHYDEMTQMALGMMGMFIVHDKRPAYVVDRDYAIMLSEWQLLAGQRRPNPIAMSDFNVLTMNSKAFPGTEPLVAQTGDRVRIRFGNLSSMDHHPIHLHGMAARVTASDGGRYPDGSQEPQTTVLVPVGSTRDLEFVADAPGDWAMHCHMTHHVMNQMGHTFPNLVGADVTGLDARIGALVPGYMTMGQTGMGGMGEMGMPAPTNSIPMGGATGPFGFIDMGGMFTIVKVRDRVDASTAASWYAHPRGTVAGRATADDLRADGIEP